MTMKEPVDSVELYSAIQSPNTEAQRTAFEVLSVQLLRIARSMLREQPDGDDLAEDCVQMALIKIRHNLAQCRNPAAFREWAAQVLRRIVIDELRRPEYRRRASLPDDDHPDWQAAPQQSLSTDDLHTLLLDVIEHGPLSDRSRRVVIGRYFEEQPDEALARVESERSGQTVLPSHIQVTRAKNLAALRRDAALVERLRELLD
jgi:RNA polymerase sigma factor (sigma-70 family)